MSTLFGHIKGAFTGATIARPGLLKAADQGLLFLDEIGELGLDEQAMLLRAVEDKRFLPVEADREAHSDFQLIVGTNRDLQLEVGRGAFREDLLARINLWTFRLAGLVERHEDIAPNLDYEPRTPLVAGRPQGHDEQGDAQSLPRVCSVTGSSVVRQLPRSGSRCRTHGDARDERSHHTR